MGLIKNDKGQLILAVKDGENSSHEEMDFSMREPYDKIIRCLGFVFDTDIFNG
ncbi:hypothetical protein DPMN_118749 [Dreissena polymorpha]|uniref:Uncharacterized protein n=1 Tax=Dreissena polymorpha TaxID=45954 RepID=A0A9D4GNN5_DREPO|nr:hypothetical protein DPMN_118749 [Dreissena polymorpha]